jgi:protease-4
MEVDAVAQGQVWSGQAALDAGLVDQLGSLADAVAAAAQLAGLETFEDRVLEAPLSPAEQLLQQLAENTFLGPLLPVVGKLHKMSAVESLLSGVNRELHSLLRLNDPNALYLQCLECRGLVL